MSTKRVLKTGHRFGLGAVMFDVAFRVARRLVDATVLEGIVLTMDTVDPGFFADDAGLRWEFLDVPALLGALDRGAPLAMEQTFVEEALSRGDRCYGAIDGRDVVAYGWYSSQPTAVTGIAGDVIFHFDASYSYMYRGYTLPAYRGKRLHGIGMARAMDALVRAGSRGLVSVVEATNTASLTSCFRLGYQSIGRIWCVRLGARRLAWSSKGCAEYGMRLEHQRPGAATPEARAARRSG